MFWLECCEGRVLASAAPDLDRQKQTRVPKALDFFYIATAQLFVVLAHTYYLGRKCLASEMRARGRSRRFRKRS
jgi:hypothetical protein